MSVSCRQGVVYIVEDDPGVRGSLELLVRSFGWEGRSYESAEAFLAEYEREEAGCLVLDLHLPGMNGVELQRVLLNRGNHLPVVVVTAHDDGAMAEQALAQGAVSVLAKPFDSAELLTRLEEALG